MIYSICTNCNWIHFMISRKAAETEVIEFNEYFKTLDKETQKRYLGIKESRIEDYETCFRCGYSYKNCRLAKVEEVLSKAGNTIQPIIHFED